MDRKRTSYTRESNRHNAIRTRLFFSAETAVCAAVTFLFNRLLAFMGYPGFLYGVRTLYFIVILLFAVFGAGEMIRRAKGWRSLFRDRG